MSAGHRPEQRLSAPALQCTVVVATFNRARGLQRLLQALESQDVGPERFEVIVVDDGSSDDTWRILSEFDAPYRLRWLWQSNQGPGAARNAAILAAESEIIVTLDDDVEPAPDLLRRHIEAQRAGPVVAMGRFDRDASTELQPWTQWEFSGLERQYGAMVAGLWSAGPRQFYTANSSAPRRAYLAAGLFDQLFRRAEDVELAYRFRDLQLDFRFLPEAVIRHSPRRSFEGWQSIASQYGFYDVMMWRHKRRSHMLNLISHEFRFERPRLMQLLARGLIGRRRTLHAAIWLAGRLVPFAARLGFQRLTNSLLSGIFNLLYWQAVADAIGGARASFLTTIAQVKTETRTQAQRDSV